MENLNLQVESYLNDYLTSDFNPDFAVLLQGDWGCGKTWFIKNLKKKYDTKDGQIKLIYITLYGVTKISEINDQIFQQLHPVLSRKDVGLAGKLLKGLLKATLKVDFNNDNQSDGSVSIMAPDIKLPEYLRNTNNCALIFDDLERCSLDLGVTLGFINSLVEHQSIKSVIIANEEELYAREKNLKDGKNIYKKIKEKLIGKTLKITHNVDKVYDTFVKELNDATLDFFFSKAKKQIIEIFKTANYKNLRHLKQGLWDFSRFYKSIPQEYRSHPDLMNDLVSFFFAFNFEIKKALKLKEILKLKNLSLFMMHSTYDEDIEPTHIEKTIRKYDFFNTYSLILPIEAWYDLFNSGFINEKIIKKSLKNCEYFLKQNQEPWITLWHYYELDDDTFRQAYKTLKTNLKNKKYTKPGEILQIYGIHLKFSDIKLIPEDRDAIVLKARKYIDTISGNKDFLSFCTNEHSSTRVGLDTGWNGLDYAEKNSKAFKKIESYLIEKIDAAKIQSYPKVAKELLADLEKDVQVFCEQLYLNNNLDKPYFQLPVLSAMDPNSFLKFFFNLSNTHKRKVSNALKRRYNHMDVAELLLKEFSFIQQIKEQILEEADKNKGTLYGHNLKEIGQNAIGKIHKDLTEIKLKKDALQKK